MQSVFQVQLAIRCHGCGWLACCCSWPSLLSTAAQPGLDPPTATATTTLTVGTEMGRAARGGGGEGVVEEGKHTKNKLVVMMTVVWWWCC